MSATVTTATTLTADTWPIGAATLMFGGTTADGRDVTTAGPGAWRGPFAEIAAAGFTEVDLMSSFIRIGDLDAGGRSDLSDRPRGVRPDDLHRPGGSSQHP